MQLPTYDLMLRPVLELATRQDITRRSATRAMQAHFGLSDEQMAQLSPGGNDTTVHNRAGWAMTYLTKAGLIAKVAPRTYRSTPAGVSYLQTHTGQITNRDLLKLDSFREFASAYRRNKLATDAENVASNQKDEQRTPIEVIDGAIESLHADVRQRLLDHILGQDSAFFERLVLALLAAMGYGGAAPDAVRHTGKSGDEGIDGRINEDALGLDQVLVQAKRFAPDQVVSRKEIQAFIGSLAGQGVSKGVFITTSAFAATAQEFVQRGSPTKVILIDGQQLIELMMRYKVGVRVERTVEVLDIDQNYFSDE